MSSILRIFAASIREIMSNKIQTSDILGNSENNTHTPRNQDFAASLMDISGYFRQL